MGIRSEIQLMAKALKGWNLTDEKRREIVDLLFRIITDPASSQRTKLSAVKAIQAGERVEQGWEQVDLDRRRVDGETNDDDILKIAARIDVVREDRSLEPG